MLVYPGYLCLAKTGIMPGGNYMIATLALCKYSEKAKYIPISAHKKGLI
jgi:hypothetical protein